MSSLKDELSTIKKDGPANLSGEFLRLNKETKSNNLFGSIIGGSGVSNAFSIGGGSDVSNPFSIGGGGVSNVFSLPSKSGASNVFNIPVKGANQSNIFTIPKANANNLISGRKEGQQVLGREFLKVGTGEGILKYNADNTIT